MCCLPVFHTVIWKAFSKKDQVTWEMREVFPVKDLEISLLRTERPKIKPWPYTSLGNKWSLFYQDPYQQYIHDCDVFPETQNKSLFPAGKFKAFRGTSTKLKLTAERTPLVNKLKIPYIAPNVDLTKVHLVVKKLFAGKIIPAIPLAGRLKHFLNSWNSWKS